jgi:hypothetical protein
MTATRRWALVALAVALIIGVPVVARALPAHAPDRRAVTVLAEVRAAAGRGYSGMVELDGGVKLPITTHFSDVGALLGSTTTLRVWWHSSDAWRVDKVLTAGETDLFHSGQQTTQWDYEAAKAVVSDDPDVRLPRDADLVPPALAARLLVGVRAGDVTSIPARRVAGVGAVGIEVRSAEKTSSIGRVDLWADPSTGLVLRLDVYPSGGTTPSFRTFFTSFSRSRPGLAVTRFAPPSGVPVTFEHVLDIADAANQYAPFTPPAVVAGLARSTKTAGAVGVYGSGLSRILAIPLRRRDASVLLDQISSSDQMVGTKVGPSLEAGPIDVLVTDGEQTAWLLISTVNRKTLVAAARDLESGTREDDR